MSDRSLRSRHTSTVPRMWLQALETKPVPSTLHCADLPNQLAYQTILVNRFAFVTKRLCVVTVTSGDCNMDYTRTMHRTDVATARSRTPGCVRPLQLFDRSCSFITWLWLSSQHLTTAELHAARMVWRKSYSCRSPRAWLAAGLSSQMRKWITSSKNATPEDDQADRSRRQNGGTPFQHPHIDRCFFPQGRDDIVSQRCGSTAAIGVSSPLWSSPQQPKADSVVPLQRHRAQHMI
jgi:hypothetical protein